MQTSRKRESYLVVRCAGGGEARAGSEQRQQAVQRCEAERSLAHVRDACVHACIWVCLHIFMCVHMCMCCGCCVCAHCVCARAYTSSVYVCMCVSICVSVACHHTVELRRTWAAWKNSDQTQTHWTQAPAVLLGGLAPRAQPPHPLNAVTLRCHHHRAP